MVYDIIIVGCGPAGMSAAIYSSRYMMNILVVSSDIGGLAATAHKICNFISYPEISGMDLTQKMYQHLESMNVKVEFDTVTEIQKDSKDGHFIVKTELGNTHESKKIIFTGGTEHEHLNIPGEHELLGKGVSYCATCDGAFFKNKIVAVVGGGDAALTASLLLSEYADKVYIIYRQDHFFRAEPAWVDTVLKNSKIECLFNEEVVSINGTKNVENLSLKSGKTLPVNGIFVEVGSKPNLKSLASLNITTEKNHIVVDNYQRTNVLGFFAAGDITNCVFRQIVVAAGQGAVAAYGAYIDLKKEEKDSTKN